LVPARRWLLVAAGCAVVVVAVYFLAVWTVPGQALENAALRGADEAAARDQAAADETLGRITVYSLAAAVVLVGVVGLLRRRADLALVLPRPSLVPLTGHYADNSLPSGHTAIAMTVLFAAVLVVPYRWRGVTLFVLLSWAVGIGAYTVTAKWHRLSDTLAADAIALGLACLASWWLARRGAVHHHDGPRRIPRVLVVTVAALAGVVFLALGTVLIGASLLGGGYEETVRNNAWVVYLAASSFASFGSIAAALTFLATWRRLEIG
jgi:hypothetical protein